MTDASATGEHTGHPDAGALIAPAAAPLTFDVLGAAPPPRAWLAVLEAIAAWPTPETLLVERRLIRRGRRTLEQVRAASDAIGLLGGAEQAVGQLLRPLRRHAALRPVPAGRAGTPAPAAVALLGNLGIGASGPLAVLAAELHADLEELPPGSGVSFTVWRSLPEHEDARHVRRLSRGPGFELQLLSDAGPPLRSAVRLWSPAALPSALLARVAALTGLADEPWRMPEIDGDLTAQAAALRTGGAPPMALDLDEDTVRAVNVAALSVWLGCPELTPLARGRTPRIGRPFTGRREREGALLGKVLTPKGSLREYRLPWVQRRRHLFVCGRTGSGKSELVSRLVADDLADGRGLVLLDPHGDLADRALAAVPEERRDEVVLIEPHHPQTAAIPALVPGLEPPAQLAQIDDLYDELFGNTGITSRWRRPGRMALELIAACPGVDPTFTGLDQVMTREDVREGLTLAVDDPQLRARALAMTRFDWDMGTRRGSSFAESAGRFAFDHAPRWNLQETLARGGIVIAKLDVGALGSNDTGRFGRMLLRLAFNAMTASRAAGKRERPALSLIVDEAHLFSDGAILGALLAQSRKFGAALTLCSQAPTRLGNGLLTDVLTNCATVLAMQLPGREATCFAERDPAAVEHIARLPKYHAVALLDDDPGAEAPLVVHPSAPRDANPHTATALAAHARARCGRNADGAACGGVERFAQLLDALRQWYTARTTVGSRGGIGSTGPRQLTAVLGEPEVRNLVAECLRAGNPASPQWVAGQSHECLVGAARAQPSAEERASVAAPAKRAASSNSSAAASE